MSHPGGRPTTYTEEVLRHTLEYFENFEPWYESPVTRTDNKGNTEERMERIANPPPSILDLHRYLKDKGITVSRWSLYDWSDIGESTEIQEFSQAIKKGIARIYPEILQENAMMNKYAQPFAIFAAKNRMKWTDKQELSGPGGGAITIKSTPVDENL